MFTPLITPSILPHPFNLVPLYWMLFRRFYEKALGSDTDVTVYFPSIGSIIEVSSTGVALFPPLLSPLLIQDFLPSHSPPLLCSEAFGILRHPLIVAQPKKFHGPINTPNYAITPTWKSLVPQRPTVGSAQLRRKPPAQCTSQNEDEYTTHPCLVKGEVSGDPYQDLSPHRQGQIRFPATFVSRKTLTVSRQIFCLRSQLSVGRGQLSDRLFGAAHCTGRLDWLLLILSQRLWEQYQVAVKGVADSQLLSSHLHRALCPGCAVRLLTQSTGCKGAGITARPPRAPSWVQTGNSSQDAISKQSESPVLGHVAVATLARGHQCPRQTCQDLSTPPDSIMYLRDQISGQPPDWEEGGHDSRRGMGQGATKEPSWHEGQAKESKGRLGPPCRAPEREVLLLN